MKLKNAAWPPSKAPRLIIAGANSGSGKTTVACGIMRALVKKGVKVSPFKCGPDYIDPLFHAAVTGTESGNLDTFLFDGNTARYLLAKNSAGADISVIEGVMGYYDGIGESGTYASTYDLAVTTDTPSALVVNCKGMSTSALAVIKGFAGFRADSRVVGVILNNVSRQVYEALKPRIEQELGLAVFGFLPKLPENCAFESRYLGLVTPAELADLHARLDALAEAAAENIDLDAILRTANGAAALSWEKPHVQTFADKIKIAVAKDKAFCFHYRDNLELLKEMGAELEFFSPLKDGGLPEGVSGLILCGGYPELYLDELSRNRTLMEEIGAGLSDGLPCIAECGGFMYLNRSLEGVKTVGFLKSDCYKTERLSRFGYIKLTAGRDNLFCEAGGSVPAHEYHYFDCAEPGGDFTAGKLSGREWKCCVATETLYAGFPHIHFYGNLKFAEAFYMKCAAYAGIYARRK